MLTKRQLKILGLIIQKYIEEENPIGSKRLMEEGIDASSATIRNDMSALEAMGLLQKNHISSGRIPSLLGYKYYVEHLLKIHKPRMNKIEVIHQALQGDFATVDELLSRAVVLLADLTSYTSFAVSVDSREQILTDFRIIPLNSRQALVVMVSNIGDFENKVVNVSANITTKDLVILEGLIRERLLNQKLLVVYSRLKTEFPMILQRYFPNSTTLLKLLENIWNEVFIDQVYLGGSLNLLNYNVVQNESDFRELYAYVNDREHLLDLIQQINTSQDSGLGIHLGLDLDSKIFFDMSLLTVDFHIGDKGRGTLGLIGPLNIPYSDITGLLQVFSQELTDQLTEYSRYLDSAKGL